MMKKTMYEITNFQREIMIAIELADGEITPEMENAMMIAEDELHEKSEAYLEVIGEKESYIGRIDAEIKRLQGMKKANQNLVTRLKDNLLLAVKTFGEFEVGLNKFGTRKRSSIEVEDVNELPEKYKVIKVTYSADKMALKKAIQNGEEIDGVKLVEHLNLKIN